MSVRAKTLVITGLALALLLVVLYLAAHLVVLRGFADLEQRITRWNVDRVAGLIEDDLLSLDTLESDWAKWDDTYEFVENAILTTFRRISSPILFPSSGSTSSCSRTPGARWWRSGALTLQAAAPAPCRRACASISSPARTSSTIPVLTASDPGYCSCQKAFC